MAFLPDLRGSGYPARSFDEEEVSLNGGCICENEATIWGYTKYSPDFLMDIASFCIFPIGEKKDPPDGKKDESVV